MSEEILSSNEYGQVTKVERNTDVTVLNINHQNCVGQVSLYGGQVLAWQPTEQHPVFWLSRASKYEQGKAIRGGIPLCWPWFGPNTVANVDGGNHGFARQLQWQITSISIKESAIELVLACQSKNESPLWTQHFTLQQTISLGKVFEQILLMKNLSDEPVQYTGALHSYFAVSSPSNTTVDALSNVEFYDKLRDSFNNKDVLANCSGPLDRVYDSSDTMIIEDKEWQRHLKISSSNCRQWVLWNPGKEIAANMTDIHDGGENEYVCLEAANTEWQTIPGKGVASMLQRIEVIDKDKY